MVHDGRTAVSVVTQIHEPLSAKVFIGETLALFLAAYLMFVFASVLFGMLATHGDADEKERITRKFVLRVGISSSLLVAYVILNEYLHGRPLSALFAAWDIWEYALSAVLLFAIWHRWNVVTGWIDHLLDRHLSSRREKTL